MAQVKIRKLTPYIAAEVEGLDPRAPIDAETWQLLSKAFDENGMLIFRDIDLDAAMQHRIIEVLYSGGDVNASTNPNKDRFSYVSNKEENGGAPYGRLLFHTDMMWSEIPQQVASLYAVEAQQPSVPTIFTSTVHAWKTLPEALKARVKGLHARHESGQQGRGNTAYEAELIQPQWDRLRDTITPVAQPHPRTGETMLYVCEQQTREIVELPKAESDALLDTLFAHLYRPECVYAHQWRTGDFVAWDNQVAQHGRPYVPGKGAARTLRKIHAPYELIKQTVTGPSYDRAKAAM
jgi:taurine dioxygenase